METLATELLKEIKRESKRRFILLVICLALLFTSNLMWLIAWNLFPVEVTSMDEYEMQGEENSNVFYNGSGEVRINEPNQSNEGEDN